MPLAAFDPPQPPDLGADVRPVARTLAPDFRRYTPAAADGINSVAHVASLKWSALEEADGLAIEAFFVAQGATTPFTYALSGDVTRQWICDDWQREVDGVSNLATVTATLTEDFSLW